MRPVHTRHCTKTMFGGDAPLPYASVVDAGGRQAVVSAWRFGFLDLLRLLLTRTVHVTVLGERVLPMYVEVLFGAGEDGRGVWPWQRAEPISTAPDAGSPAT